MQHQTLIKNAISQISKSTFKLVDLEAFADPFLVALVKIRNNVAPTIAPIVAEYLLLLECELMPFMPFINFTHNENHDAGFANIT